MPAFALVNFWDALASNGKHTTRAHLQQHVTEKETQNVYYDVLGVQF